METCGKYGTKKVRGTKKQTFGNLKAGAPIAEERHLNIGNRGCIKCHETGHMVKIVTIGMALALSEKVLLIMLIASSVTKRA